MYTGAQEQFQIWKLLSWLYGSLNLHCIDSMYLCTTYVVYFYQVQTRFVSFRVCMLLWICMGQLSV